MNSGSVQLHLVIHIGCLWVHSTIEVHQITIQTSVSCLYNWSYNDLRRHTNWRTCMISSYSRAKVNSLHRETLVCLKVACDKFHCNLMEYQTTKRGRPRRTNGTLWNKQGRIRWAGRKVDLLGRGSQCVPRTEKHDRRCPGFHGMHRRAGLSSRWCSTHIDNNLGCYGERTASRRRSRDRFWERWWLHCCTSFHPEAEATRWNQSFRTTGLLELQTHRSSTNPSGIEIHGLHHTFAIVFTWGPRSREMSYWLTFEWLPKANQNRHTKRLTCFRDTVPLLHSGGFESIHHATNSISNRQQPLQVMMINLFTIN